MHVTTKWVSDYKFSIAVASKEGAEPFLTLHGNRLVDGSKGEFVSAPAEKDASGKYWPHYRMSDAFQKHVLELAKVDQPEVPQKKGGKSAPKEEVESDDVPF